MKYMNDGMETTSDKAIGCIYFVVLAMHPKEKDEANIYAS
jgi:hypothetical protein